MTRHEVRSQPRNLVADLGNILGWLVIIGVMWFIRSGQ